MAISCRYCGGAHERADEVRACWQRTGGVEVARADDEAAAAAVELPLPLDRLPPAPFDRRPVAPLPAPPVVELLAPAQRWAGPDELGRHLVIGPGDHVPAPWADAPRLVIDTGVLAAPDHAIERLRLAGAARTRLVIELRVPFHDAPQQVDERALHLVGPLGELPLDTLHHLVWTNSVVQADGGARWAWAERAIAAGASAAESAGDVRIADDDTVWVDGGPTWFRAPIDGVGVLPHVCVEHGSLVPPSGRGPQAELAADQLAAVGHPTGGARIVAPAGSGKTRVLTERTRHLVREHAVPPGAISLVAYNRRAQAEMQQRLTDVRGVQVRTLNAIALAIVNGAPPFAPRARQWRTVDERGVRAILGKLVQAPRRRQVDPLSPWLAAMSTARLGLRHPDDVEALYDGDVAGLGEVLRRYERELDATGQVDFDGQITGALRVLLTDPTARAAAQRASRLLLVDELQDLTPAHILLVRLLAGPGAEVFGVGDDDQTIYGYNGADPRFLLDFATAFPGAGSHDLHVNYRCPADVVTAVDHLLQRNTTRVPKTIVAARACSTGLRRIAEADPVEATVTSVRDALTAGRSPAEVAVLARVNAVLVPVQVALGLAGVPVASVAGRDFLERTSVRAVLAWVRLTTAPQTWQGADLAEAARRPGRGISPRVVEWIAEQRNAAGLQRLATRLEGRDADKVNDFAADLERATAVATRATTSRLVGFLCDDLGLGSTLATLDLNRRGTNAPSQGDDLLAVRQLAELHHDPAGFPAFLAEQLARPGDAAGVTLATVHRVKGQEWPHVVVHLADAEQFPHRLADDLAEERRIFHVALTRGGERVDVVSTLTAPSPFLDELDAPPDPRRPAPAATRRPAPAPSAPAPATPDGPLRGGVAAGVGLQLVDGGATWTIVEVDDEGALATGVGPGRRRFPYGAKVETPSKQRGKLVAPAADLPATSPALYDVLRRWRESRRHSKPAYTVFDDATLERLAIAQPADLAALARVRGIGPAKLEQYGDDLLALIGAATE